MLQLDMTLFILWWVVPILMLLGRAGLAAYRTKKKREELHELESKSTPYTAKL